ncbi:MAG: 5-formyltetrahydrofolate cyclo-ligase [Pyrinomonadaceae bacterium]
MVSVPILAAQFGAAQLKDEEPRITKSELRQLFLEKRRSLSPRAVAELSLQIADRFFSAVDLATVGSLHTFIRIPKFNEIDTSNIYFRLWRDHPEIKTFAPRVDLDTGRLKSVEFSAETEFIEDKWGIREPLNSKSVDPVEMDMVLVPLVCFDAAGHRVGYGKGFYDRFLSECRPGCLKVGLSFFPPVARIDDVHKGDVALDLFVTPERIYRPDLPVGAIDASATPPS